MSCSGVAVKNEYGSPMAYGQLKRRRYVDVTFMSFGREIRVKHLHRQQPTDGGDR